MKVKCPLDAKETGALAGIANFEVGSVHGATGVNPVADISRVFDILRGFDNFWNRINPRLIPRKTNQHPITSNHV
ncbi:hypothetical protein [Nostoc sp.]|uniref:hypothetical protein n=1 Tax=Nostoc sp. TaxID=1180 RepID=UPI002FF4A6B0